MYEIYKETGGLIRVVRKGMFSANEAIAYAAELTHAIQSVRDAGMNAVLLVDNTQAATSPQDAVGELERLSEKIGKLGVSKMAVISRSAITRLQSRRILKSILSMECFDDEAGARAWLDA